MNIYKLYLVSNKMNNQLTKFQVSLHELIKVLFSLIDYLLWLLFDSSKFKRINTNEIKKILVVLINQKKGNLGGDFVTLGVLNFFKKQYPEIELSMLSDKKTINQLEPAKKINFIEYLGKKLIKELKNKNFNAVIFLNQGGLSAKDFSFIPYKIGETHFGISGFLKRKKFGYTRKVHSKIKNHMVGGRFKMLEALGFKFPEKKLIFEYSKQEEKNTNKFLNKNKIKKFIVIHPGGKYVAESYKEGKWPPHLWNLDRYAKVADYFIEKGYKIIITGTKEEDILANEIKKYSKNKNRIVSACGKLSIKEAGVLLKKCSLLIATDTAIVHIAYQDPINAKIVELMGPSLPEVVGAWPLNSPRHKILVDKGPCCRSMRKLPFKNNFNCLENIKVEEVIKAGEGLLKMTLNNSRPNKS